MRGRFAYLVWFVGAVAWFFDAVLQLYSGTRQHAFWAVIITLLFLAAGVYFRRQAFKK
ncbi:MAG: hypothetical protein K6T49_04725 [Acidobacterium ailaaui]|jgi:hypothetical protein|nr:hypothetical protein [Pseudacidobacterium ailaaui]